MKLTLLFLTSAAATAVAGPILITIQPALAPNGFGSPNYAAWRTNALDALYNGNSTAGTPGTPGYYEQRNSFDGRENMVTSFPSWLGYSDPGAVFGPAFASALGNRILFGLVINGQGTQFSISQLSFSAFSTDPAGALDFSFAAGSYNYSDDYVGILAGPDLQVFTVDDLFVTGGANTQLVDALIGCGSGNALWPCGPGDPLPCATIPERQAALDFWTNYNNHEQYLFTGTYLLDDGISPPVEATAPAAINALPEPATAAFMISGLILVLLGRWHP